MARGKTHARKRQAGAVMLIMVAILALGVVSFMLAAFNSSTRNEVTYVRTRNAAVLAQAKTALLGYVAKEAIKLSENIPGRLPCPEPTGNAGTASEGTEANDCAPTEPSKKSVGRLPWVTLGIDKPVDAESEPLWYAISPNWVLLAAAPQPVINVGSTGQLVFDGVPDVVAVIFAPGRAISTTPTAAQVAAGCTARSQVRGDRTHVAGGGDPDLRDYLECQNGSSPIDTTFGVAVTGNESNLAINDQAVYITSKELLAAIQGPLAERMQRTVAPLLSEYSTSWPGFNFLPYAHIFEPPEKGTVAAAHCGVSAGAQTREGLLPIAPNSGACASSWTSFAVSSSATLVGCVTVASTNVQCTFRYYTMNFLGKLLFGSSPYADVTVQATAPHASASFRKPLATSDVIVPANVTARATTLTPQTDGDARMSLVVRVTDSDACDDSLLGLVCSLLSPLGLTGSSPTKTIEFPQLGVPTLQGTQLSVAVLASKAPPYNLLSPTPGEPHYWFMQNEWYRYTYYAVSQLASRDATGTQFTINGFPAANGASNDKRFVLALMGPAVLGQTRGVAATVGNYVEGANAATGASPRVFAWQVYASPGNDRIATCPFNDGATPCN